MAQLYKMTMYICDLEDSLSLEEAEANIDNVLSGVATNCITHYSNEKVGPNIEWDDDIDLNRIDATTEQWEKYFNEQNYS